MTRWIEASVSHLQCNEGHITHHLTFSGDTDMVTAGFASLSSIMKNEIVVSELEPAEFADETGLAFETRISRLLGRDDLRFLQMDHVEDRQLLEGISFKDFERLYSPSKVIFKCPTCAGRNAVSVKDETLAEYEHAGGTLTILTEVKLVSENR